MLSENIRIERVELSRIVRAALCCGTPATSLDSHRAYKLCDFIPAFGVAFRDHLRSYTHWGLSHSDLVFGNLDNFIDKSADIFSTHQGFISGHFFYVRNIPFINNSFKLIRGWRTAMISPEHHGIERLAVGVTFLCQNQQKLKS